jgi:outer membrane receptor protein involved in Fe transport
MRKSYRSLAALLLFTFFSIAAIAQTTITGNVRNSTNKDVIPAVSVIVKGGTTGTYTDEKGNFKLVTNQKPPFTIVVSSVGFETQEFQVKSESDVIQVNLKPGATLGVEVVVSASRVPERILESPVSIERINTQAIRNAPAANYYDILRNIKGVDVVYSSMTYATPSTRGFNGSGNARFNQLVDGMDNQAPGLNFSVGSVTGPAELDVESMELLPGASSALYGPGGMNGTLLINSKDPFKYQGVSFQIKQGIMHTDHVQTSGPTPFYDWSLRWGQKVSEKFAFKITGQFTHAVDWIANDTSNYLAGNVAAGQYGNVIPGTRTSDPNYNGVNVYGDETSLDLKLFAPSVGAAIKSQIPAAAGPIVDAVVNSIMNSPTGTTNVSRTGYYENQVVNKYTVNFRFGGGLYYKLGSKTEASLMGNWGTGNTVYTGSDRYSLKDLKMGQYKLEFKSTNWYARAYTTQENSGESYNATVTTQLFNEAWKPSYNPANPTGSWYPQYTQYYILALAGLLPGQIPGFGSDPTNASNIARSQADVGRPVAGSTQFKQLFDQVRKQPIPQGGLFLDRTDLYAIEGQYHLTNIKFADVVVGGNWRQFKLNSQGTLFADSAGPIHINEVGAYAQVSKSFMNNRLKLSAAGRYDYNENFPGRFTPRFTAVLKVAENHDIRLSYQTAYRFPTTQNQWINLVIGGGTILIGGLPELRKFYHFDTNPPVSLESVQAGAPKVAEFPEYKPETMRSLEGGYRGLYGRNVYVDVYGYYGKYENFLGRRIVIQNPGMANQQTFSVAVNSSSMVTTYGFGGSVDWLLPRNFTVGVNASTDKITDVPTGFVSFFNVPSYRLNVTLGNTGFGPEKKFGFNVAIRNQDGFFYESDFRQGWVDGFTTIDAQVSYKIPQHRSLVKIGANNLLNKYYKTGFGNPQIGGLYYISYGYNVF